MIVIGAGPAGLMAAGQAAAAGAEVLVLEKMKRPARKLAITGKGRCNLTNTAALDEFVARFGATGEFLRPALSAFSNRDLMAFFEGRGLKLETQRGGRIFPASGDANDVVATLLRWVEDSGAYLKFSAPIDRILARAGQVTGVLSRKRKYPCSAVILATGGVSYPATGSTGDGYRLAAAFGHRLVPTRPALVPLTILREFVDALAGLELRNTGVKLLVDGVVQREAFGELAFATYGIAGPVILTLSGDAVDALERGQRVDLSLDLKPALSSAELDARISRDLERRGGEPLDSFLRGLLPQPLVTLLLRQRDLDGRRSASSLDATERQGLLDWLEGLAIPVTGYRPISEAIVTAGGIATDEIDPLTMASRRIRGLYLVGEVLDVDGDTGGYNLQAAFSSGWLAGRSAAAALAQEAPKEESRDDSPNRSAPNR